LEITRGKTMPEITLKYEHPHELTDLLGKLMQMYVVPEPICGDMPYPENYKTGSQEPQSELEKGYRDRIADLINQNKGLRLELWEKKEKLINTESELDAAKIYIDCLTIPKKDDLQGSINSKDNAAFIADSDNQLFTLEEAAEYLGVENNEVPEIMASYLSMTKTIYCRFQISRK